MIFGLFLAGGMVIGIIVYLNAPHETGANDESLQAIIRERQRTLIEEGRVDEAMNLEEKYAQAKGRGKQEALIDERRSDDTLRLEKDFMKSAANEGGLARRDNSSDEISKASIPITQSIHETEKETAALERGNKSETPAAGAMIAEQDPLKQSVEIKKFFERRISQMEEDMKEYTENDVYRPSGNDSSDEISTATIPSTHRSPKEEKKSDAPERRGKSETSVALQQNLNQIGPEIIGIQLGESIQLVGETLNASNLFEGEKFRVEKLPIAGSVVCSTESGINAALELDKMNAADNISDALLALGAFGLGGVLQAELATGPIIYADQSGAITKYILSARVVAHVFPSLSFISTEKFVSYLRGKYELPFLKAELVETNDIFSGKSFASKYYGFGDGYMINIGEDKRITVEAVE